MKPISLSPVTLLSALSVLTALTVGACSRHDSQNALTSDSTTARDLVTAGQGHRSAGLDSVSPLEAGSATARPRRALATHHTTGRVSHGSTVSPDRAATAGASESAPTSGTSGGGRRTQTVKHTQRDAAIGAAAGAVIGAVTSHDKVKGGVIGAAVGGILGGVVGNNVDVKKQPKP